LRCRGSDTTVESPPVEKLERFAKFRPRATLLETIALPAAKKFEMGSAPSWSQPAASRRWHRAATVDFDSCAQPRSCSARDAPNGNRDGCAPKIKTGTPREIQTADAAARNHPADGGIEFEPVHQLSCVRRKRHFSLNTLNPCFA